MAQVYSRCLVIFLSSMLFLPLTPPPRIKYGGGRKRRDDMENVKAFERGQKDYQGGRMVCPFTVQAKIEAWRDGWLTEQAQ